MDAKNFAMLFHHASKIRDGYVSPFPRDPNDWPIEWRTIHHKSYPRFKKIPLPDHVQKADLFEKLASRNSVRDFARKPILKDELGTLLKYSCGIVSEGGHRAQPSGGSRYPIESYLLNIVPSPGLPSGLYHYDVRAHSLTALWERTFTDEDMSKLFTYGWVGNAGCVLLLSATFARSMIKYGERGYRYIFLEAGHIGQNISLVASALGIKSCAVGGTIDDMLEQLLDIDGTTESIVYGFALGK